MKGLEMNNKIKILDRLSVEHIRQHLSTAFQPLAQELGVAIAVGSCTFQRNNCRFQLTVAVLDTNNEPISEEAELFKHSAKLFGFEPADLGKSFTFQGKSYTITGLRPRSSKYPVLVRSDKGKDYKFPCQTVLKALGREVPDWV